MPRIRHITPALLTAVLVLGITAVACDDPLDDAAIATAPPSGREPMVDDPRIGEGLPAEARFAGVEHNRLTLLLLRQARDPAQHALTKQSPCETIAIGLTAEAARTAARAGIPEKAGALSALLRTFLSTHPDCGRRIARPGLDAFTDDAPMTPSSHPDSMLTDASLEVIDRMLARIADAQSEAEIAAALAAASATAITLGAVDAVAVQAAVAQTQGSIVLWGPGGAGWTELDVAVPAQSIFRAASAAASDWSRFLGALSADGGACAGALRFLKEVGVRDYRLLGAGCGLVAAGGTVYFAYRLPYME